MNAKKTPKPSTAWTWLVLAAVLLVILAVLGVTTAQRVERGKELMLANMTQQGLILVRSLEGATRATMRRGLWGIGALHALVEEMAQHGAVASLTVLTDRGDVLAQAVNRDWGESPAGVEGLAEADAQAVASGQSVTHFTGKELIVGRSFDPLRRFRARGRRLPPWACAVEGNNQEQKDATGGAGSQAQPGHGPGRGGGRGMGWGQGGGPMMGLHNDHMPPPPPPGYALVRISAQEYLEARTQAVREAVLVGLLVFLGSGVAAWGIWAAARRREQEVERLRRQVAETEHLAAIGRLAGSVAHEVRNPLSAVRGLVQYLAKGEEPGSPKAEYAQAAVDEVDRLERVVSGLLEYTRPREPRRVPLDVAESLESAVSLMRDDPRAQGVDLVLETGDGMPTVPADPDQVRQVLVNLLVNALEALDGRGKVLVTAQADKGGVRVAVADDGPGLPPEGAEEIFDPFFSTRERGSGLGLAIARRIALAHGGELAAGDNPGGGAVFTLTLPGGEA